MFYPSIGNREYPYTSWLMKRPEYAWNFLERLGEAYHFICRQFRNVYYWPPHVVDNIEVHRLNRIYEETIEDNKKKDENLFEDDDGINYGSR